MITSSFITDYLTDRFSDKGKLSANGQEFLIPSLFVDNDYKRHLSVNTTTGLWQCFKSGNTGDFIKLYSIAEDIPYKRAESELLFKSFFLEEEDTPEEVVKTIASIESLLDDCKLVPVEIDSCYSEDTDLVRAWRFLYDRRLFDEENTENNVFYLCTEGRYKDRVIIPFIKDEVLYYFQARALNDALKPKYLNPPAEAGIRPSTILYPYDESDDLLVVCEGPLDAVALQRQGVNATCTMGCHISFTQMDILKEFPGRLIIGYDNDSAGERGLKGAERLRTWRLMPKFYVLYPPADVKDWNEAHIRNIDLRKYVNRYSRLYDFDYEITESLNKL